MEEASNGGDSIVLRTEVNLCEDDLSEQAKEQFSIHTDILRAYQLIVRNTLGDNRLSPIGRHLFCLQLEQSYTNCKNVLNYMAAHSELKATTDLMRPPLIICGLPRTGTTLLYHLLACDPACRAPLLADMLRPVPPLARSDASEQMQRNKILSATSDMFKALGLIDYEREVCASHPSFAYDEDELILEQAGLNWLHYVLAPHKDNELPTWWLDESNKDFIYGYHKIFIQMLNSIDAPQSHWLLKGITPSFFLDTLLRHYPKASLIMIHRRLDEVLASSARLAIAYTSAYFDSYKANMVANRNTVLELLLHLMDVLIHKLVEFRRTNRDTPVLDILYEDLCAQPIDTVRRIYEYFGLVWSENFELAMFAWLRDNPQGKQGRNPYTLEEFGLEGDAIEKCYEEYNSLFLRSRDQSQKDGDVTKSQNSALTNSSYKPSNDLLLISF